MFAPRHCRAWPLPPTSGPTSGLAGASAHAHSCVVCSASASVRSCILASRSCFSEARIALTSSGRIVSMRHGIRIIPGPPSAITLSKRALT
ncbi:hypothetical protein EIQ22_02000 [Xanthomonas campestris pv. campestris]